MALGGVYETGTITIGGDLVTVTGVGTLWGPIAEVGDWILCDGQVGLIHTVSDDTHLILESEWQGTLPSAADYVLIKMSWLRYDPAITQAKLRELLADIDAQGSFLFTDVDPPDPALGQDGQYALRTNVSPWQVWYKTGGVWVEQASPTGLTWQGTWSAATTYAPSAAVERNGSSYVSKTTNLNQPPETNADDWDLLVAQGATGPAGPIGLVWKGTWNSATAYVVNDGVQYVGASYIAIANNTNSAPPSVNWNLIAQAGSTAIADDTVTPPMLDADTEAKQLAFRERLYAAPLDALAYNGMQINGSMEVSQENGVSPVLFGSASTYVVDGWRGSCSLSGGQLTMNQQSLPTELPGIKTCLQMLVTTAQPTIGSSTVRFLGYIEGYRFARVAWGAAAAIPITIGFWMRASLVGTYRALIMNFDGSSTTAWVPFTYAGGFQWITIVVPGQTTGTWKTDNSSGATVLFEMASSATPNLLASVNNYASITGVVVLPGTQAPTAAQSPLIMRPYDQELVTCQRYWQKYDNFLMAGYGGAGQPVYSYFTTPQMRASPTITPSSISYSNASAFSVNMAGQNYFRIALTITATGYGYGQGVLISDARL